MAAFTHLNPEGSRFADDTFGAFYAAASLDTSIAETRYHREIFMRSTRQKAMELDMRTYLSDVSASFHDIRGKRDRMPDIYDPDSYVASQKLARSLKLAGSNGVAFDSVRHAGGECLAVYRPRPHSELPPGDPPEVRVGRRAHRPGVCVRVLVQPQPPAGPPPGKPAVGATRYTGLL